MDLKKTGNLIFILGQTKNELGASHYYKLRNELGANIPRVDLKAGPKIMAAVAKAISDGLIESCHDCSEGGLAVAVAEMAFAGELGMEISLDAMPLSRDISRLDQILFSESTSRFIVELKPENIGKFAQICKDIRFGQIGKVTEQTKLIIKDANNKTVIDEEISELKEAWQKPLRW